MVLWWNSFFILNIDTCLKSMLTWNQSLKMKHLKKKGEGGGGGGIYYQWNHESTYVMNFVNHKNNFDNLKLKCVLSKSWSWFFGIIWDFLLWSFCLFKRRFVEMIYGILDSWLDPSFVYEMVEIFVPLNSSILLPIFEFMHVICWRFETMFWYHAYPRNVDLTNWLIWKWIMIFLLNVTRDILCESSSWFLDIWYMKFYCESRSCSLNSHVSSYCLLKKKISKMNHDFFFEL